ALLRGVGGELAFANRALSGVAFGVEDANARAPNLGHVAFLEEHEATRHGQQRGHIRSDEVLAFANANDDRTTGACDDDRVWILFGDDRKRVSALELGDGRTHSAEQIAELLLMMMNSVRDDFRIRLG